MLGSITAIRRNRSAQRERAANKCMRKWIGARAHAIRYSLGHDLCDQRSERYRCTLLTEARRRASRAPNYEPSDGREEALAETALNRQQQKRKRSHNHARPARKLMKSLRTKHLKIHKTKKDKKNIFEEERLRIEREKRLQRAEADEWESAKGECESGKEK